MGQAQPLAGWCWVFSVVHAQMGPCFYIELRVWRCRTNRRTHHSDMPRTSGTYRNTWTEGFGCRQTMLAEYHHFQHLKMWIPSKRKKKCWMRHWGTLFCINVLGEEEKCLLQDYKVSRGSFFSCLQVFCAKIFSRDEKERHLAVARCESKMAAKRQTRCCSAHIF